MRPGGFARKFASEKLQEVPLTTGPQDFAVRFRRYPRPSHLTARSVPHCGEKNEVMRVIWSAQIARVGLAHPHCQASTAPGRPARRATVPTWTSCNGSANNRRRVSSMGTFKRMVAARDSSRCSMTVSIVALRRIERSRPVRKTVLAVRPPMHHRLAPFTSEVADISTRLSLLRSCVDRLTE